MQSLSWALSNFLVVEHITLMTTMSDYRHQLSIFEILGSLSVAGAVAFEHRLGLTKAAAFVPEMDPWFYPHDISPAIILVQSQVQSVVAQASRGET
jgi:hypothetical protein